MYRSLLFRLQPIHPSQERLCTDLSYYDYSQYILPRNVYVQFSLITFIANPSQERLCTLQFSLITIKANASFPGTFMSSSLLLRLQPIQPSQERLRTVGISTYNVSITLRKMKIFLNNWCFHINGKILIFSRTRRLTNNFKTVLELSGQELTFLYYKFSYEILSLLNP